MSQSFSHLRGPGAALALAFLVAVAFAGRVLAQSGTGSGGSGQTTPESRAVADRLLQDVRAGIARFSDMGTAQAEGYRQATPYRFGHWGPAHFNNEGFQRDGRLLDPARPEALVYLKLPDGYVVLLGAMFLAHKGQGPRPGGAITEWHVHDNLCLTATGAVALATAPGRCPAGSFFLGEAVEMMHVWMFDHPEGAFAHELTPAAIRAAMQYATHRR